MNYEAMIRQNQMKSAEKRDRAIEEIHQMAREGIEISVGALVRRTGLSRAYFYNNQAVKEAMRQAMELQAGQGLIKPQEAILNQAMAHQLSLLQRQLERVQRENHKLREENKKLREENKKLSKIWKEKALDVIHNL